MLSEGLRLARVFHDMNQSQMANALGVSNSYLSEIESGKKRPTLAIVEKYSEVLGVPTSSLMFFSEQLKQRNATSKTQEFLSRKILKMLNWIETMAE